MRKILSILLNVAIVVGAGALLWVLIKRSPSPQRGEGRIEKAMVGARVPLSDIDWSKASRTLVMVLKKDCPFCQASMPFYRRLTDEAVRRGDIQTVLIFPKTESDIQAYVKENDLSSNQVLQEDFRSTLLPFGITSAPTVMITGKSGIITQMWVGQLSEGYQLEVTNALDLPRESITMIAEGNFPAERVDEESLKRRIKDDPSLVVVDLRSRESYKHSHFDGARNIPGDEISSRALDELADAKAIVIYSYQDTDTICKAAYWNLIKDGFRNVAVLKWQKP